MRGMFCNSRGLSDLAKHKHVGDCVREHGLDFVAILEAGKCDCRPHVLDHLSGGFDYTWHSLPAREGLEESFLGYRPPPWTCWLFRLVNFI